MILKAWYHLMADQYYSDYQSKKYKYKYMSIVIPINAKDITKNKITN